MIRIFPNDSVEAREGLKRVVRRSREQETGEYDFVELARAGVAGVTEIDAAGYKGAIEIKLISSRVGGRGIVASRGVKAGDCF